MQPSIRIDIERIVREGGPVAIELGCGAKRVEGRITIDKRDLPGVDIVADLEDGLPFLPDRSVDAIHCRSVLEHVEHFERLMSEILRVLKDDGAAHIFVPHFSNPYYYSDYTHKRPFGLYTFYYFVGAERQPRRKVPCFYTRVRFEVVSLKLKFRSPFRIIHATRKLFGAIVNLHPFLQEFYEGNLCHLVPCDGIEVILRPVRP
jgi:SAM-dependent methyltransferase